MSNIFKCARCNLEFPMDPDAGTYSYGQPPKWGHLINFGGMWKNICCCRECWEECIADGFDLSSKERYRLWSKTDWAGQNLAGIIAKRPKRDYKAMEELAANKASTENLAAAKAVMEQLAAIKVTTGDVKWDYEIDRVLFSIGGTSGSFGFLPPSPDVAFRRAELALKEQAAELGCDAVIYAQFEHRITVDQGLLGPNQGVEVFAYGTAVRRKHSE